MVSVLKRDWFVNDFTDNESDMDVEDAESDAEADDELPKGSAPSGSDGPSSYNGVSNSPDSSIMEEESNSQSHVDGLASPNDHTQLLFITELVQNVFSNLPFSDLVTLTGVCKTWQQLLRHETPTAFQTFLKPILKAPFVPITFPDKRRQPVAKLMGEWHRSLDTSEWCEKERCARLRPHRTVGKPFNHPVFYKLALNEETCLLINGHSASFVFLTSDTVSHFLELHEHSAHEASWRKMLLTNPPVKRFTASPELPGDVVENGNGVELGEVAIYMAEMMKRERSRNGSWRDESRSKMVERILAEEPRSGYGSSSGEGPGPCCRVSICFSASIKEAVS